MFQHESVRYALPANPLDAETYASLDAIERPRLPNGAGRCGKANETGR
jgi:hypothetical protein